MFPCSVKGSCVAFVEGRSILQSDLEDKGQWGAALDERFHPARTKMYIDSSPESVLFDRKSPPTCANVRNNEPAPESPRRGKTAVDTRTAPHCPLRRVFGGVDKPRRVILYKDMEYLGKQFDGQRLRIILIALSERGIVS